MEIYKPPASVAELEGKLRKNEKRVLDCIERCSVTQLELVMAFEERLKLNGELEKERENYERQRRRSPKNSERKSSERILVQRASTGGTRRNRKAAL